MPAGLTLICPVRGRLKAKAKSADGLTPSEERFRVEAIRNLVNAGYPKENIRVEAVLKKFGNAGRNSFRADIAVLDKPVSSVGTDVDEVLKHALLLGEVKRDNAEATTALAFQVKPMLDFAVRDDCVALYWDDVVQRVYWKAKQGNARVVREGPLADLPAYGQKPGASRLTFATIDPDKPLLSVFERIEDLLHSASIGPNKRFGIMLQLLLAKLHDEHQHEAKPNEALTLQDFEALEVDPSVAADVVDELLAKAVQYYQPFMPEPVAKKLPVPAPTLVQIMKVLAPIKIISMKQSVIQDFYMYFAKHIYKWDLAQYFTPTPLTDFIVELVNPRWGEHVKDPACGSADFLTAAFRRGQAAGWTDYASNIWGTDISPEAVQVAVLNMILNGDGKSNVQAEDALAKVVSNEESSDVVVCNPPFGLRIVERNKSTLKEFDLGYEWEQTNETWTRTKTVLARQETGILFAEACVRTLRPAGRLALIVPNGYLGNRSPKYHLLREWILRHCRLGAIVALPRFTFKSSGADVSASILFLEKRETTLAKASDSEDYDFAIEVIDRVGWVTGDKGGAPTWVRDPTDGTFVLDDDDETILDSDFPKALARIRASDAAADHPWLADGQIVDAAQAEASWTRSINAVLGDPLLTMDPKRHSRKNVTAQDEITSTAHFRLGDVVDFLPERATSKGKQVRAQDDKAYNYVEIQDVEVASYRWTVRRGWDLPSRARHFAEPGDIYIGAIWNSVRKWFLVGAQATDTVVTNGMHRLRIKPGQEDKLLDLVAGLCSEAYSVQMRAHSRGSDGLAEITHADAAEIRLPIITDPTVRAEIQPFVDQLLVGYTTVEAKVASLLGAGRLPIPATPLRPDHTAIV